MKQRLRIVRSLNLTSAGAACVTKPANLARSAQASATWIKDLRTQTRSLLERVALTNERVSGCR
jgi:hypothetical protein